jgi:FkbM family methyltransferase
MRAIRIGPVAVQVDDDQPTFWDRVEANAWEPGTLLALQPLLGPGVLFLDIGAWIGPLTLFAAGLGARVIAVEADPRARAQLGRNLTANPRLADRVTVIARAAAPSPGPVRLGARRKPGDSMSSALLAGAPDTWDVEAVTPEELASMLGPGERLVIKLDIEGGEYVLLPALAPLIERPGANLVLSLHPGILVETGEADPAGRALAALAIVSDWNAARIGEGGSMPDRLSRDSLSGHDTWLLHRRDRD